MLDICCDRDLDSLDPVVREVLRLGTHQLLATRIQPHAAVATSVNLVKDAAGQRPAGLRQCGAAARCHQGSGGVARDLAAPTRDADLVGHLAVRYSHPRWIVEAFAAALGEAPGADCAQTEAALAADSERPAVHLCVVPGLADRQELVAAGCAPARWSPFGAYLADGRSGRDRRGRRGQGRGPGRGQPARRRRRWPGSGSTGADARWLDLCAGPGGKARLLAGLATGAGRPAGRRRAARAPGPAGPVRRDPGTGSAAVIVADGTMPAWREPALSTG